MKKLIGAFFAACLGLAWLSGGYAQVSLPFPGPGGVAITPSTDCAVTGAGNSSVHSGTNTVYTFTSNGTLLCATGRQVQYVLVAGGGGGGNAASSSGTADGAGGGAGGVKAGYVQLGTSTYNITIGAGGTSGASGSNNFANNGVNSSFDIFATATGGGGGGAGNNASAGIGRTGGSAGGSSRVATVGTGIAGQGNNGGGGLNSGAFGAGGGGGATGVGGTGTTTLGGTGGIGYQVPSAIFGSVGVAGCVAGGGGGGVLTGTAGNEGQATCGGGKAGTGGGDNPGVAGVANTGGGGGGATGQSSQNALGGTGGSGVLYVSHPTTLPATICTANTQGGGTDANVVGLWHLDQITADNSGSGHAGTLNGAAAFSASIAPKFGTNSLFANTQPSYMNVGPAWSFASAADFTVEWWENLPTFNAGAAQPQMFGDAGQATMQWYYSATNSFLFQIGGTNRTFAINPSSLVNAWHHWAVVRSSSTMSVYVDGMSQGTPIASATGILGNGSANICFVSGGCPNSTWAFGGNMQEVRVSNLARYTANFTPQTTPFCDYSGPTWRTIISPVALPSIGSAWTGYMIRDNWLQAGYASNIAPTTQLRVTFAGNGGPYTINSAWIGHAASNGTRTTDFDGTQVQLKFSGSTTATVPTTGLVSDAVTYSFSPTKDLVLSVGWGSSGVPYTTSAPSTASASNTPGGSANAGNTTGSGTGSASTQYMATTIEGFW
jgi:hypothetical protein